MMYGIINPTTGEILAIGPDQAQLEYPYAYNGDVYEVVELDDLLFDGDHDWDAATRTVVPNLAHVEKRLHEQIDQEAGAFRQRFITTVPGQEMTYLRKEQEARAYLAGTWPDPPMITAEAQATGQTVMEVAQTVIAMADQWAALGAAIEGARLGAKKAVSDAATLEAKIAAAVVDWEALLQ